MQHLPPGLRAFFRLTLWMTYTLLGLPCALLTLLPHTAAWNSLYVQWYMRGTCMLFGLKPRISGEPPLTRGTLFVANHASYLDILVLASLIPMRFTPKSDIRRWPVFGLLTTISRPIYINRNQRSAMHESFRQIRRALAQGDNVVIFPEGTTSDGSRVMPFKSSMLQLAAENDNSTDDIPLQPITLAYTALDGQPTDQPARDTLAWYGDMDFLPHFWQLLHIGSAEVHVHIHPPIHTTQFPDRKALTRHCEQVISAQFSQFMLSRGRLATA